MDVYDVLVRNELTGELTTVVVTAIGAVNAQVEALHHVFHSAGWHKAVAMQPALTSQAPEGEAAPA